MDFDKAKFLALSPQNQQKTIDDLREMMGQHNIVSSQPQTPPNRIEVKRELQSPDTPHHGGSKKVIKCNLIILICSFLKYKKKLLQLQLRLLNGKL